MKYVISFVHTADLHLDSPFVGLAELDDRVADLARRSTFQAYENVIRLCLERSVDFLLVAGDVYDGADRSLKAQLAFRNGLERLSDSGICSYIVHGNHDPLEGWASSLRWPKQTHIFGATAVDSVPYGRNGETQCIIHGISFAHRQVKANLARQFRPSNTTVPQIGLLHCNVGNATGHEPYAPCSVADLHPDMAYWALGHVHTRNVLSKERPTIVYPGNTQGLNINEAGERGCMLVRLTDQSEVDFEFVPTDAMRWRRESVQVDSLDSDQDLLSAIEERIGEVQKASAGRPSICRLRLVGRGGLHRRLQKADYLEDLLRHSRDVGENLDPLVWIDRIIATTQPLIDVETRIRSQDLVGDLLRITDEYKKNSSRMEEVREFIKELYEHGRCRKWLSTLTDEALLSLLGEAEVECLDRLVEEDSP